MITAREADRLGRDGLYRVVVVYRIQHSFLQMSSGRVTPRSPTSTVSSGSGTGVVATWTISGSGGGKATLRPSHSGGVVDRISRAAVTERVVLITGSLLSIPAIYSLTMTMCANFIATRGLLCEYSVNELEIQIRTWALLRWCFTKGRYIKCTYLYLYLLLIRLPEQTNQYLRTKYKHKQYCAISVNRARHDFHPQRKFCLWFSL